VTAKPSPAIAARTTPRFIEHKEETGTVGVGLTMCAEVRKYGSG
jgi:hypothetical protein